MLVDFGAFFFLNATESPQALYKTLWPMAAKRTSKQVWHWSGLSLTQAFCSLHLLNNNTFLAKKFQKNTITVEMIFENM